MQTGLCLFFWLRNPTTKRIFNILKIKFPVYLMYCNKKLRIMEGEIPYGIKTDKRITRQLLRQNKPIIPKISPIETALEYAKVYAEPSIVSKLQVAQRFGVTRARVCQIMNLLNLDKKIIEYLLNTKDVKEKNYWTERRLRQIAIVKEQDEQIRKFGEIVNDAKFEFNLIPE